MKLTAWAGAVLATGIWACHAQKLDSGKIVADVNSDRLKNWITQLDLIAKQNGGNRAFNTPGYKASVDLVLSQARKPHIASRFDTVLNPFHSVIGDIFNISLAGPDGKDVFIKGPNLVPPTPPSGISGRLLNTPVDDTTGSMCLANQWDGIDATGKIVLVKRGVCALYEKVAFAKAKGAVAVLIYNQTPGTNYTAASLTSASAGNTLSTGLIPLDVAQGWIGRLEKGESLSVTLKVNSTVENVESWNVIAQSKAGDPDKVIMVGAHLDSVFAGPGINDNGSGSAALLEILELLAGYDDFEHAVRFAWWGDEEDGMIGSYAYVDGLNATAGLDKVKYYFNYDMVGSPNPRFAVFGFDNSGQVPRQLQQFLVAQGKNATVRELDSSERGGSSDYAPFFDAGIPNAMINTGAGGDWDACYHLACDDGKNYNIEALTLNTKAAAHGLALLANSLEGIPGRKQRVFEKRSLGFVGPRFSDVHGVKPGCTKKTPLTV
ncbi:hypothetical protein OQA88_5922 [Cercophora sp. LCS_1]